MASIISSILSTLHYHDMQGPNSDPLFISELHFLKFRLRNLNVFVLCAIKMVRDAHLESLLLRIEDAVRRFADSIYGRSDKYSLLKWFHIMTDQIVCFEEEIDERYKTMPDHTEQSVSFTAEQIIEITDSVIGSIVDFPLIPKDQSFHLGVLLGMMEALGVQMIFLKNFLAFTAATGVDNAYLSNLLAHFETVSVNAARLFIKCPVGEFDEIWCQEMQFKCLILLEKIQPVDPIVCETYIKALNSLKLSTRFGADILVFRNFLDSLISDLWDLLRLDAGHLDSLKDQRQVLYEGLRFLRTILKKQLEEFYRISDQIGPLVCDAGVLVCSFQQTQMEFKQMLQDLLKRINLFQSENEEKVPEPAIFNFPNTNELAFLDSLLENLLELSVLAGDPNAKSDVQTIWEELSFLRTFIKQTREWHHENEEIQALRNHILKVAYRVEFLIDQLALGDISNSLSVLSYSIVEEISDLKIDLMKISFGSRKDIQEKKLNTASGHQPLQRTASTANEDVIFHEAKESIINELKGGSALLKVVAIWGMGGVGKTTFASKIFNDPTIMSHFHVRAWCPVSQVFDRRKVLIQLLNQLDEMTAEKLAGKRKVLLELLEQTDPKRFSELTEEDLADKSIILKEFLDQMNMMTEQRSTEKRKIFCQLLDEIDPKRYYEMTEKDLSDNGKVLSELLDRIYPKRYSEMTEEDLADKVRRSLKQRRYIIFLDDVWTIEVWDRLQLSFPDDSTKSRILVTSRNRDVAPPAMLGCDPHPLCPLSSNESFELLEKKLFHGKDWPQESLKLGMQIAENCSGLPLIIVTVAGLLATMEHESWKDILDHLRLGSAGTEQFMNTMELSYKHLPDYLKPCLLYFGAFPEDQEFLVKRLIQLWVAEGFIEKTTEKRITDVADEYLKALIERSLVTVAKQGSTGGHKSCRIHDLVHDFCSSKAKTENFFHLLKAHDRPSDYKEPSYMRRLCIYEEGNSLKDSKLFCPRARSLMLFSNQKKSWYEQGWLATSFIIPIFKLLKVLDLEQIYLGDEFPSEMELLLLLKYLSVRGGMDVIPASIGNLQNLETFVVYLERIQNVTLPHTLWNLKKLKWLSIHYGGGILPIENLENSSILFELESFSGAVIHSGSSMEKQLKKFPNIRRLKCDLSRLFVKNHKVADIVVPDFMEKLESLHLLRSGLTMLKQAIFDFCLPAKLKKLTLSRFGLPWSKISTIGKLPKLEVLKLLNSCFVGDAWDMEEGDFSSLRFLKLSGLNFVRWAVDHDDQLTCLQNLELDRCKILEKIPSCLGSIYTLEMIDVISCSERLESVLKNIEREQVDDIGNSSFKIRIR